jgi:hypothetical protein
MISFEDCVSLCGLSPEEVSAIAEHEHIPEVAATALASYLGNQKHGPEQIRTMIVDDIRAALGERRIAHAAMLFSVLQDYLLNHSQAQAGLVAD